MVKVAMEMVAMMMRTRMHVHDDKEEAEEEVVVMPLLARTRSIEHAAFKACLRVQGISLHMPSATQL